MRLAGTSSWRVDVKGGYLIELALFVREAARLDVAGFAEDVPVLIGVVPDSTAVLEAGARRDAVDQWRQWWAQILELEFLDARMTAAMRVPARDGG